MGDIQVGQATLSPVEVRLTVPTRELNPSQATGTHGTHTLARCIGDDHCAPSEGGHNPNNAATHHG